MNSLSSFGTKKKIWISILFGISGLIFSSFGLAIELGEISINIPLSILFPIFASVAFGWRYGLITGLSGGALFPFLLWANNGWSNVLFAFIYLLLYSMLGLVNHPNIFKKLNTYYLRIIVVLIVYLFFNGFISYFLFNPVLSLNPPFWVADAIKYLPQAIINKIIIKESVSVTIIILVSDTLLELPVFRKLLGIPFKPCTQSNNKIFMVVVVAVCFTLITNYGLNQVFLKGVHELDSLQKTLGIFGIITVGLVIFRVLLYYNEISFKIKLQLNNSEGKFKSLFENINDAILILKDGVIIDCNQKSLDIFGCSDYSDIIGKTTAYFSPVYQKDGRLSEEMATSFLDRVKNEQLLRFEWQYSRLDGSIFEAEVWLNRTEDTSGIFLQAIVRDITIRKKTEKQISMLAHAVKSISECVIISDLSDNIIFVNRSFLKTYQYDEYELLGNSIAMVRSPNNSSALADEILPATLGGGWNGEIMNRRKDGSEFPVFLSTSIIYDEKGNPLALIGVTTDITKRKRAEDDLKESERKLRESQAVARLGSYSWDILSGSWESSDILDDIFGIDESYDRNFEGWVALIHPDFQEIMKNYITNEVLEKQNRFDKTYKIVRHSNGLERWVHGLGRLEFDTNNLPVRLIGTISDITDRKIAEDAIVRSEIQFRTLYEKASDGIIYLSLNGEIVLVNNAFAKMHGYTVDEIMSKKLQDLDVEDISKVVIERIQRILNGDDIRFEVKHWHKDGHIIDLEVTSSFSLLEDENLIVAFHRDITDRKHMEETIRNERTLFRTIIDNIPDPIYAKDINRRKTVANIADVQNIGAKSESEVLNKNDFELFPKDLAEKFNALDQAVLQLGKPVINIEDSFTEVTGKKTWFLSSKIPFFDSEGSVVGLVGINRDITKSKLAEEKLHQSKQRLIRGESVSKTGNWELNPDTGIISASQGAAEIFWRKETEISLSEVQKQVLPEYQAMLENAMPKLIEENKPFNVELKIKNEYTGDVRDIHSIAEYDHEKRIVFGIVQDITDLKQMGKALRESEEIYKKVTTLSGYLVFDYNPDNGFITWSGAIEQLTGYTEIQYKEMNYKKWIESIHPDDREKALSEFEEVTVNNKALHSEYRYKIKSGDYIWIGVLGFKQPVNNLTGYKVIGIVRDISQYKTIEERILQGVIKSEEGARLKFSQEVHDGLGPLISAIKLYVQLFSEEESKMGKDIIVDKVLVLLDEATNTLREISFNLSPLTLQNYGIVPALKSFIEKIKDSNKIDIIFNYYNIDRYGEIIETIIYRIICECINNTIKHAHANGILIEMISKNEILEIVYTDNGIGFDTEQVLNTPKGVGLLNMQSRIKSINGYMKLKSNPGSGTRVQVKLKL